MPPPIVRQPCSSSRSWASRVVIAPRMTSEWPLPDFVSEHSEAIAPRSSGCLQQPGRDGVVHDHGRPLPPPRLRPAGQMSHTRSSGLVGVSAHSREGAAPRAHAPPGPDPAGRPGRAGHRAAAAARRGSGRCSSRRRAAGSGRGPSRAPASAPSTPPGPRRRQEPAPAPRRRARPRVPPSPDSAPPVAPGPDPGRPRRRRHWPGPAAASPAHRDVRCVPACTRIDSAAAR